MKRKGREGEIRSNIHKGGLGEAFNLDNYTKKIVIQAAKALEADICGVDILESASGPKVIEVNLSPGLQGITEATKIDIADKIAKYLYDQTVKLKNKDKKEHVKEILQNEGIKNLNKKQEIISNLDFRGERILLPELITKISDFDETDEMIIKVEKGSISIKKFKL